MTALYQRIWLTNMLYGILIGDSSSEGELCWEYKDDPEFIYDGASMDPSQPCDNVRGVSYTPPGWRRVYLSALLWIPLILQDQQRNSSLTEHYNSLTMTFELEIV